MLITVTFFCDDCKIFCSFLHSNLDFILTQDNLNPLVIIVERCRCRFQLTNIRYWGWMVGNMMKIVHRCAKAIPSVQDAWNLRLFVDADHSFDQHCLCVARKISGLVIFRNYKTRTVSLAKLYKCIVLAYCCLLWFALTLKNMKLTEC